jgi:hypothetical protein
MQSGELKPLLSLLVLSNANSPSITDWFNRNNDPSGTVLSSGAFQVVTLSNGLQAAIYTGKPMPPSYNDGYIDGIAAMTPSTRYVVTGNLEEASTIQNDIGGSVGLGMTTIRNIIENMRLP